MAFVTGSPAALGGILLILAAASPACGAARSDSRVDAYVSFVKLVQKGETSAAFAQLSSAPRPALEQRAKEISDASGGAVKTDPAALFFSGNLHPRPVTEVKVVH